MLSLLLTLSLGQVSYFPPINAAPFGFDAPLEPIRVEGAPAILRAGQNVVAVWLDRRRGLDLPDAGLDVWAGTFRLSSQAIDAVMLTPAPRACAFPVLVSESTTSLVAAWACQLPDGGALVETTTASTGQFAAFQPTTVPSDVSTQPILGLRAVASPTLTVLVPRRAGSLSWLQTRPPRNTLSLFTSRVDHDVVVTVDAGISLLAADALGDVTVTRLLDMGGWTGPTSFANDGVSVVGLPGRDETAFVFQSPMNQVRHRNPSGAVTPIATNTTTFPPLATASGTGTLISFRQDGGTALHFLSSTGAVTSVVSTDAGVPIALAPSSSSPFVFAERLGREVVLRQVAVSANTPAFGAVSPAFRAPAPQRGPSAGWSPNDMGFITFWDQRTTTGWETHSGVVDESGGQPLAVVGNGLTPANATVVSGRDGGLYVAMNVAGVRGLFEVVAGLPGTMVPSQQVLDEVVMGESSFFTWSPASNLGRHSTAPAPQSIDSVRRGCVGWWQGTFWYVPASGSSLVGISESGIAVNMPLTVPVPLTPPYERCLTIGDTGQMLLTTTTPFELRVHDVATGFPLGPFSSVRATESPALVPVGDGVIAVVATEADGQNATLKWVHFRPGLTATNPLTSDTQPVRNVRAAKDPNGGLLASWETFELDGGTWRVQTRLLRDLVTSVDAGARDAGVTDAGVPDAGVLDASVPDAGVFDAGVPDASVPDAGVPDASVFDPGVPDAGGPDAGVPDAGVLDGGQPDGGVAQSPVFVAVCGCSSGDALSLGVLALLLLRPRRRATP